MMRRFVQRLQGYSGVIFWSGISRREQVDPIRLSEGVEMTSEKYGISDRHLSSMVQKKEPYFLQQNYLHA